MKTSMDFQDELLTTIVFLASCPLKSFYTCNLYEHEIALQGFGSDSLIAKLQTEGFTPVDPDGKYLLLRKDIFRICFTSYNGKGEIRQKEEGE